MHDAAASGRFTNQGNLVRVATEEMDVRLHPLNGQTLVIEAGVGDTSFLLESWASEPTHCAKTVVQSHEDNAFPAIGTGGIEQTGGIGTTAL